MQALMIVHDLNRIGVLVESSSRDDFARLRDEAYRAVDWHHLGRRIHERPLERACASSRPDLRQIGSGMGADAADSMAGRAAAFAFEDRSPTRHIAGLDG